MTTAEINANRLDIVNGPLAALIVELAKRYIKVRRKRKVTTAPVQPPADFAAAVAEVTAPGHKPTVARMDGCNDEIIGDEFSRQPWAW